VRLTFLWPRREGNRRSGVALAMRRMQFVHLWADWPGQSDKYPTYASRLDDFTFIGTRSATTAGKLDETKHRGWISILFPFNLCYIHCLSASLFKPEAASVSAGGARPLMKSLSVSECVEFNENMAVAKVLRDQINLVPNPHVLQSWGMRLTGPIRCLRPCPHM